MLVLSKSLINTPIISLQTGQVITRTQSIIVDPANLRIIGFNCTPAKGYRNLTLLTRDIRDFASNCILVNSHDSLSEAEDIIRLKPLLQNPFRVIGSKVHTVSGSKIGIVEDFVTNTESRQIQKIYVTPNFINKLFRSNSIIDREQIVDSKPGLIIVKDALNKILVEDSIKPTLANIPATSSPPKASQR